LGNFFTIFFIRRSKNIWREDFNPWFCWVKSIFGRN